MRTTQDTLNLFAAHLEHVRPRPNGIKATCPVCHTFNLVVSPNRSGSGIVLHCFYQGDNTRPPCAANAKGGGLAVLDALGLTTDALYNEERRPREVDPDYHGHLVNTRTHTYTREDGSVYATKEIRKYEDGHKRAYWYHTATDGQREYGLPEGQMPLYHADLLNNNRSRIIFVAEGEKDADNLTGLIDNVPATSLYAGAETRWSARWNGVFNGMYAVLFGDNDAPGQRYVDMIANAIAPIARGVLIIPAVELWEQLPPKGDISDVLDNLGREHTKALILTKVMKAFPDLDLTAPAVHPNIAKAYAMFTGQATGNKEGGADRV